jgi:hypothetical protein
LEPRARQLAILRMIRGSSVMKSAQANTRPPDFLVNMSASADVLAQAKVEIDLAAIPEGKNVRLPALPTLATPQHVLTRIRSLSNGEASPSSSATAPTQKSKRPRTPSGKPCAIPRPTRSASRSPNGSSCWASARTWDACLLARPVTLEAGSARATALTTISLAA